MKGQTRRIKIGRDDDADHEGRWEEAARRVAAQTRKAARRVVAPYEEAGG